MNQPYPDGFFTEWSEERRNAFFAAEARAYDERRLAPPDAELDSREASPPIDLDYVPDTPDYGERDANTQGEELLPKLVPISFVEGEVLKPRKWIVHDGWIPTRKVTLAQGNGGDGKTSLVHQLQSSCATALPWIALRVEECASIGFYTEDEEQDLKERQAAIDAAYGQHCASTGKMHLFPRAGEENELLVFDRARKPSLTTFYRQVCEAASDFRARLVVLDVAVDLFGGNEIVRQEVRALFRPLHTLARKIDGAVVMTSHVSQAGIQSDGGHSGSTDWSNAVRSRLYLSRPKGENGEPIDPNARILTRKKANFASIGDTVKLHWKDGVIVPDTLGAPSYFRRPADDVFLALLDEHCTAKQPLSESRNAANFAPRVFASAAANARDGYAIGDFKTAMESLFKSGKIRSVNYGRSGDERRKVVRCDREE